MMDVYPSIVLPYFTMHHVRFVDCPVSCIHDWLVDNATAMTAITRVVETLKTEEI